MILGSSIVIGKLIDLLTEKARMSGIEVAGLVLGAFPLVIAGVQFYINGCDTVKRWRKWESVLAHLARNVKAEHRIFRNICKRLELEIIHDGQRQREVTEAQIDALEERLGDSYDDFVAVARDLAKTLAKCRRKLDLDKDGNVSKALNRIDKLLIIDKPKWLQANSARREWSKIKLSFSEKDFDKLLERIDKNNRTLRRMLKDSSIIGDLSLNYKAESCCGEGYSTVRAHAKTLYYILDQSLSSTCNCSNPHDTNLRLEARRKKERPVTAAGGGDAVSFTMMFLIEKPIAGRDKTWNWRKAIVEPLKQGDSLTHPQKASIESRLSAPEQTPNISAALTSNFSSLMAVGSSNAMHRHASSSDITALYHGDYLKPKKNKSDSEVIPVKRISNLCHAIRTVRDEESCLGVLVDESDHQHRISMIKSLQSTQNITLKTLLDNNINLTSRDRLILGTKLVATLLQLYRTPWLSDDWGREDIHFVKVHSKDTPSAYFQEPFITRSFVPNGGLQATGNAPTVGRQRSRRSPLSVRVPPLFSLGILLIELSYCKPIETLGPGVGLPGECDTGITQGMCEDDVKFCVALRLLEPHNDQGMNYAWTGLRYANAVRRCIRCDLDVSEGEYDSDAFHAAVYQGVMEPLMQTLKSHCGESDEIVDRVLS